jgi:transposase InsO family protein
VSDKLADGRSFRILTIVDQFTRECVGLEADRSVTGMKVAVALEHARHERGHLPESITVDNGSEFCSRALEAWAMRNEVQLCFIRPGRPVERIYRELQWPAARRVFERRVVRIAGRCTAEAGEVSRALQSRASAQFAGGSDAGSVCGAAPGES